MLVFLSERRQVVELSSSEALLIVRKSVLHQVVFGKALEHVQLKVLSFHVLFALLSLRISEVGLVAILRDNGRKFLLSLEGEHLDDTTVEFVGNASENGFLLLFEEGVLFPLSGAVCDRVEVGSGLLLEVR